MALHPGLFDLIAICVLFLFLYEPLGSDTDIDRM